MQVILGVQYANFIMYLNPYILSLGIMIVYNN